MREPAWLPSSHIWTWLCCSLWHFESSCTWARLWLPCCKWASCEILNLKQLRKQLFTRVGRECIRNVTFLKKCDSKEVKEPITASETWSVNAEHSFPLHNVRHLIDVDVFDIQIGIVLKPMHYVSESLNNIVKWKVLLILWGLSHSMLYPQIEKMHEASVSSVQFSHSVVSDSLQPHESQHARPPCPSPTPRVYWNPCPSSQWCHSAISSSVILFSFCPQSLPASGSFPMSQLFTWGDQNVGVSASASVLPMNTTVDA